MNGIKPRGFKFISILSRSPVDKLKSKNNYSSEIQTVRNFIDHASWSSWLQLRKKERKKRENRIEKETRSCPIFFPPSLRSQWTFNTGVERGTQLLWSNGEGERKRGALCRNLNGCRSEIKKKKKEKRKRKEDRRGQYCSWKVHRSILPPFSRPTICLTCLRFVSSKGSYTRPPLSIFYLRSPFGRMGPYGGECINNAIRFYCGISKLEECSLCVKGTKRRRESGESSRFRMEERRKGCGRSRESTHTWRLYSPDSGSGMRMKT